jgi:hypothetical protein
MPVGRMEVRVLDWTSSIFVITDGWKVSVAMVPSSLWIL